MPATQNNMKVLEKEMHDMMEHAQALIEATSDEVDDNIKSARSALQERLKSARKEYGEIEEKVMAKVQSADDFIHAKPYYAIGGSFIVGLLFGWSMSRK